MHLARRFSPVLAALFTLVVAFAVFGAPAAPAQAHDALASSDPAPDAVLDTAPSEIALSFTGNILGDGGANAVIVTDASGAQVQSGDPVVDGPMVTQPLSPDAGSGAFTVTWRVVSSDGHPISGEFAYSVDAPAASPSASPPESPGQSAEPSAEPSATASATPIDAPTDAPLAEGDAGGATVWIIVGIAVVVLAAILLITMIGRRRAQRGKQS